MSCESTAAPSGTVREEPWAQRRYGLGRLSPVADGRGTVVAVIDSGVDPAHPQLAGRVLPGADFLDPGGDGTRDCVGHGTAVASLIAAAPARGVAFRGVAPEARILPVRVSEQQIVDGAETGRTVPPDRLADAIRWAVDHDADVLNLSVVLYADDAAVRAAIGYAVAHDVVVVAAVGNRHGTPGADPTPYPAAYAGVLGVGAITEAGQAADYSQAGTYVDLVAPGGHVLTAVPGGGHAYADGTSYAAPFGAATAALVRQRWPDLTVTEVIARIVATTDPAPGGPAGDAYGYGVLNPYRAVADTVPAPPSTTRPAPAAAPAVPAAQAASAAHARTPRALALAAAGLVAAALTLWLAVVVPRARRRAWRSPPTDAGP
ncbi:type VII secretion-associated serine protease mycosin [Catenuloplanes atrovinosus]|uniref:Type VII secretion-associated serine protease mycosin n=1 Tax=Catenuloplanes atrovinosus TaxID=137266 RepID=A0AAE3YU57_9ACTN|nr:type VII secretion-associated serine protease mycosin [Catenuloplanes atrovinosus]MDR7279680.1 type VII secretion-associated serine protease mycosin [Catenuloplanes atrovinosus]